MAEVKKTRIKKKRWYQIIAPKLLRNAVLGEVFVADPNMVIGKIVKANLMGLTNNVKQQNINLKFKITSIQGDKAYSELIGFELVPTSVRRLVRKGIKRIDESFVCVTSDGKKIRIKPFLLIRITTRSSTMLALRKQTKDFLTNGIKKTSYENLISSLMSHRLQSSLRDHLKKIYPLRTCEIRKIEMEKEKVAGAEEKAQEAKEPKAEVKAEVKEESKGKKEQEAKEQKVEEKEKLPETKEKEQESKAEVKEEIKEIENKEKVIAKV